MRSKPNILILMTDQQRHDCLSCAGHPLISTPNMDRLARQGMRFTQATTSSPVCMPARNSFITGLYPHSHGMWNNSGEVAAGQLNLFHLLKNAGYSTAYIGKSHYYAHEGVTRHLRDREPYMHRLGIDYVHETTGPYATLHTRSCLTEAWAQKGDHFERFERDYRERAKARGILARPSPLPVEDFPDSYVGRKAIEFVDSYDQDRPVCLFVGFGGPHDPWDAPGEYASMYDPSATPAAIPAAEHLGALPTTIRDKWDLQSRPDLTPEVIAAIRANYYGKISLIDRWCGDILLATERNGWNDNLLVVFWSDHGEMLGDHGRIQKCTFHESSVRVPLILSWPGTIPQASCCDALVELVDLLPTVANLLEIPSSAPCEGQSLVSLFSRPQAQLRDNQLSEIEWGGSRNRMLRGHRFKYAEDSDGTAYMLYDLENDPKELRNLAADAAHNAVRARLHDALAQRSRPGDCH
ncbi:MAG: sulfatase-like hydrolase/transferase [Candidatus Marinimicrobia bacterium]|nr:sulfatase-like hydrolase/transferase [Candidatus Neomarinimicrobiota bacterium]